MYRHLNRFNFTVLLTGTWLVVPDLARACSTCFGAPDDPAVIGIKVAMFSMLGVTGTVLGGFASFFIHLHRKSNALLAASAKSV
ncbi:MAG: hypothetical protein IID14_02410 [Candidatus Marinimicrobia bacterium]|nr:hypothetical protein [Candidatus Neomarinimicrobiota bacterium]